MNCLLIRVRHKVRDSYVDYLFWVKDKSLSYTGTLRVYNAYFY